MVGRLLKVVLALAGLVVTLSLLVVGVLVAAAVLLWSLLRGRKPALRWRATTLRPGADGMGAAGVWRQAPTAGQPASRGAVAAGEVVDVEAREVPASRQAISLD
jgi:hypothetical protein